MSERPRELDEVELTVEIGDWPAGTRGAVVSVYEDSVLVEIVEGQEERDLLDCLVGVADQDLRIVHRHLRDPGDEIATEGQ
jgi:hypothetical protein